MDKSSSMNASAKSSSINSQVLSRNGLSAIQLSQLYNKTPPLRKPRLGKNPSNEANTVNIFAYSDGVHFGMAGVVLAPARKRMI